MLINFYLIPTFYEKLLKDPGGNVGSAANIIIIFLPVLYTKPARNYCDIILSFIFKSYLQSMYLFANPVPSYLDSGINIAV